MAIKEYIDLDKVQKEVNKVFEKVNESFFGNYKRPSINISQNTKAVQISVKMDNLSKEDIILKINHMSLDIIGEKNKNIKRKDFEENSYKGYRATIGLPTNVNIDKIEAEYKNNFLNVTIPKMKTKIGSKIEVK